jgi:hypothetical protein
MTRNVFGGWRGKLLVVVPVVLLATIIGWFVALFAFNNSAKYGTIPIPGSAVVHLPAGEVDLSLDTQVTSFGGSHSSVSVPIPTLTTSVVPVGGGRVPGYENSVGGTTSVNSDAHRRFAKIDVPTAGKYRVQVSGDVNGFIEPELELGAPGIASNVLFGGLSIVFALALLYTLTGLGQQAAPPASGRTRTVVPRRRVPWKPLALEVLPLALLLFLLFSHGSFHIAPAGAGQTVGAEQDLLTSPLPSPTAADVIPADSASSLFREANLAKALAALTQRIGAKDNVARMAIYPGELDLVDDDSNGNLHRIRVSLAGTVTVGPASPTQTSPQVIYADMVNPSLIAAIEASVPVKEITKLTLGSDAATATPYWTVATVTSTGRPGPSYQSQFDGTGLTPP